MTFLRRRAPIVATTLLCGSLLGLAGCGTASEPPEGEASVAAEQPTSAPDIGAPASRPSTSSRRPAMTDPVPPRRRGLRRLLLTAGQMPGLDDQWEWQVTRTAREGADAFGACQRVPITSIGAERVVVRWYGDAGGSADASAAQLVARFADAKSAWRAQEVLKSWREKCPGWLRYPDERVSDLATVSVPVGFGASYLAQYGPATDDSGASSRDAHFDGLGIHRHRRFLSLVQVSTIGQDYNYEPGQEPASVAVRRVARKFAA